MINLRKQVFQLWFRLSRPMTLGARAVVENQDGAVLMVRHTYTKGLHFPGGGVEHGEPVAEALRRELLEEGGVRLMRTPDLVGIFSNHRIFRNDHVLLYRVRAEDWRPEGDPIGHEISELVWTDPLNPPEDATAGTVRRLNELFQNADRSDYW